jgi:hypothetical protein
MPDVCIAPERKVNITAPSTQAVAVKKP